MIGDRNGSLDALRQFEVSSANCYDPNEQLRLMAVISALGRDRFNTRIHALAESLAQ